MSAPRLVLCLGSTFLIAWGSVATVLGQLPGESDLPGRVPLGVDLPAESELPEAYFQSPSDRPPDQTEPSLPSESMLPRTVAVQAPADDTEPAGVLQLAGSTDDRPWLRLITQGVLGTVRTITFSSDSQRVLAAGDNKEVVVWKRTDEADAFAYERTIRWQVQRGERGRIYAQAVSPSFLAVGGFGAMGGLGEIVLFKPETGALLTPLVDLPQGHRKRIVSLAASPDPSRPGLVSMDHAGKIIYWLPDPQSGLWQAKPLAFDEPRAVELEFWRMLHPLVMLGGTQVVAPVFAGYDVRKECLWQLRTIDVQTGRERILAMPGEHHHRMVTALTATPDGRRLASADERGNLYLWNVADQVTRSKHAVATPITAAAFSPDGNWLVLGTTSAAGLDRPAAVQLWDVSNVANPRAIATFATSGAVLACSVSPDGRYFAYSQGTDVSVRALSGERPVLANLRGNLPAPRRVAFATDPDKYLIAFGSETNTDGSVRLSTAFDSEQLQLLPAANIEQMDWRGARLAEHAWTIRAESQSNEIVYWLYEGEQRRANLPLRLKDQGAIVASCWIGDQQGVPVGVVVGTNGNNGIYVFRLQAEGTCAVMRQFRGHSAPITSLALSPDRRYLASGSLDGTIDIWKLEDYAAEDATGNRWGIGLELQDGAVVISRIREDGPLYFRGLRAGDAVRRISIARDEQGKVNVQTLDQPNDILRALQDAPHNEQIAFECLRGRTPVKSFQSFPAWHPVASLFVNQDREWAFWTPAGYYDASFEGHKLFGWQVNRGLQAAPSFFLAAQVRRVLERPQIMSRLLKLGSLETAFQQARIEPPADWSVVLAQVQQLQPQIVVTSPAPGQQVAEDSVLIETTITVPLGERLIPPKAFANGVIAVNRELLGSETEGSQQHYRYRWATPLPSNRRVLVQVIAATESEVASEEAVAIERLQFAPRQRPRLFVIAAGVNQYRDGRVPDLDFAVNNAQAVAKALRAGSETLYETRAVSFLNQAVTRSSWQATMVRFAEELKSQSSPDDLLVVFLSGHGVHDEATGRYYFVTADAEYSAIRAQQFSDCLSFEDFSALADVPCRKLLILDTCHSGAVQPLRQDALKSALRALQDDIVLTITASEGAQEAVEDGQRQLGRFTFRLLEALQGLADSTSTGNRDGQVSLKEVALYVRQKVVEDSVEGHVEQFPTAGPAVLFDYIELPLTASSIPLQARLP